MPASDCTDAALREHLVELLDGGGAHLRFDEAVADLPAKLRGRRPEGLPYSPWELLEHMRLAQWDILEFSRRPDHQSPPWPEGYWPPDRQPPDGRAWQRSIRTFRRDNKQMRELVRDTDRNLFEPFAWGDGQTLFREAMLVADHNSYHLGQLIVVRRLLGAWRNSAMNTAV
jgi:hypothetical protein